MYLFECLNLPLNIKKCSVLNIKLVNYDVFMPLNYIKHTKNLCKYTNGLKFSQIRNIARHKVKIIIFTYFGTIWSIFGVCVDHVWSIIMLCIEARAITFCDCARTILYYPVSKKKIGNLNKSLFSKGDAYMSHFLLLGHFRAMFNHFLLGFFHFFNQQMVKLNIQEEKCALYL